MDTSSRLIRLIEDDPQTRRLLKAGLGGWAWRIAEAGTGEEGLAAARSAHPDLIIVDPGLPDTDGVALVRRLRRDSEVPVLVLSARSRERDKIDALDSGADDYLTKPFSTGELNARLKALLRRAAKSYGCESFEAGALKIDLVHRRVIKDGAEVRLTPIEFRLISLLVQHPGASSLTVRCSKTSGARITSMTATTYGATWPNCAISRKPIRHGPAIC